ncbi:hypothetical protein Celaphus_00013374 [Cervus elaphus hippelaphus]|uniref:Guanine nucleotide-binding protein subunit gamma n=1 Tax=Cervus elaphus hippelaphus TaxID=46360 RepID=A0A212DG61_CEREH|nr:hypothetical protein Celaphus_00013374 [Cervus elaphus hippelaphus]
MLNQQHPSQPAPRGRNRGTPPTPSLSVSASAGAAETRTSPPLASDLTLPSGLLCFSCFCCYVRYSQLQLPARMKGETPVNSTMSIGQARKMVEQLKIEASLCRIKVSKAAADLMTYCDAHACEDPLITPVPTSENPFREKKFFCALL